jgi:hypothetical protein
VLRRSKIIETVGASLGPNLSSLWSMWVLDGIIVVLGVFLFGGATNFITGPSSITSGAFFDCWAHILVGGSAISLWIEPLLRGDHILCW